MLRDHQPVLIEEFRGLWRRGTADSTPPNYQSDLNNVQFEYSGIMTRDGLDTFAAVSNPLRMYTYVQQTGESLLLLVDGGVLVHYVPSIMISYIILTIPAMTDFSMVSYDGRAYITPHDGTIGLQNESIYVYKGDGTPARKAGGAPPQNGGSPFSAANGAAGFCEAGFHQFAVIYETDTGFQTALGPINPSHSGLILPAVVNCTGAVKINLTNIPVSPDSFVVARSIVATRAIDPAFYTGDPIGYQYFFVPGGRIADNTTASFTVDFFDAELLKDASHLLDLFTNIPAGVGITTYHNRLVTVGEHDNISLARVSYPGEPEAVDQVSGLLIVPLDGNPLTNCQEFRDVLYLFKKTRTIGYADNGDVPSTWQFTIMDQGIGASIHGIATVIDYGGVNIDFLLIVDFSGVMQFNGSYIRPELSWAIRDFWLLLDRTSFKNFQIYNDSLLQRIYINLLQNTILMGDYSEGMVWDKIKWTLWTFNIKTSTITLIETNKLLIASHDGQFVDTTPFTILLEWTADPSATNGYELKVGTIAGGNDVLDVFVNDTSYSTDLVSGQYFARTISIPSGNTSNDWSFTV